jgi:hypothetical protein
MGLETAPSPFIPPCLRHEFWVPGIFKFPELKNSELEFWKNGPVFPELE